MDNLTDIMQRINGTEPIADADLIVAYQRLTAISEALDNSGPMFHHVRQTISTDINRIKSILADRHNRICPHCGKPYKLPDHVYGNVAMYDKRPIFAAPCCGRALIAFRNMQVGVTTTNRQVEVDDWGQSIKQ